jgi:hypothetical protein
VEASEFFSPGRLLQGLQPQLVGPIVWLAQTRGSTTFGGFIEQLWNHIKPAKGYGSTEMPAPTSRRLIQDVTTLARWNALVSREQAPNERSQRSCRP